MVISEFEMIAYRKLKHLNVLLNNIIYRNFHIHNELELLCVFSGDCRINVRGHIIRAERGSVVLVNHNEAHEIQSVDGADMIIIQLSNHMLREYFPQIRTTFFERPELTAALDPGKVRELWTHIYDISMEYFGEKPLFELRCVSSIANLIRFIYENEPHTVYSEQKYLNQKKTTGRINRIVSYIHEKYDSKVSLVDLAEKEGLTSTYLSHFFRDQFGITFQEYVGNIRFEQALRFIANGQMSLTDIAIQCGYSDVKYMTKMFRERFGCTPRGYTRSVSEPAASRSKGITEFRYSTAESLRLLGTYVKSLTQHSLPDAAYS